MLSLMDCHCKTRQFLNIKRPMTFDLFFRKSVFTVVVLVTSMVPKHLYAQSSVANQQHLWFNLSEKITLDEKHSISALYSFRRNDFIQNWQQSLLRVNMNYKVSNAFTATLGYDFVVNFPYGEQPIKERFHEHRSVQQFAIKNFGNNFEIKHLYRLEQRFMLIPNDFALRHRFRYRLTVSKPIRIHNEMTSFTFVAFDELFVNMQRAEPVNYFDQNWAYGGLNYKLSETLSFDVGYMNQFFVKPDGMHAESNHTIMLGIKHKIEQSDL